MFVFMRSSGNVQLEGFERGESAFFLEQTS